MAQQNKDGWLKPGAHATTNQTPKAVDHVDVNNKREPKPVKTTTQRLKRLR